MDPNYNGPASNNGQPFMDDRLTQGHNSPQMYHPQQPIVDDRLSQGHSTPQMGGHQPYSTSVHDPRMNSGQSAQVAQSQVQYTQHPQQHPGYAPQAGYGAPQPVYQHNVNMTYTKTAPQQTYMTPAPVVHQAAPTQQTVHVHRNVVMSGGYNSCRCDTPTGCCICAWVSAWLFFPIGCLCLFCEDHEYRRIMQSDVQVVTTTIST